MKLSRTDPQDIGGLHGDSQRPNFMINTYRTQPFFHRFVEGHREWYSPFFIEYLTASPSQIASSQSTKSASPSSKQQDLAEGFETETQQTPAIPSDNTKQVHNSSPVLQENVD